MSALDPSALQTPGEMAEAVAKVRADAERGEASAWTLLALFSAAGLGAPQSWTDALAHLAEGAERGSASARGQLTVLAPDGAAESERSWAERAALVDLRPWFAAADKRVLVETPRTVAVSSFLPPRVRQWLIDLARGRVAPAKVYGSGGEAALAAEARSNSAIEFGPLNGDVVLTLIRARIAATIGVPVGALENSQVLHYAVGQRFAPHFDYLDESLPEVAHRGQRIVTFLVYLNDDFEGGETDFPRLALRHKGSAGDALYFANIDLATQATDPRTLHAGLPPTRGEKWLFSQWVRNKARV